MNKEETMLRKRLVELSDQAYSRDIVVFSDFLNLNELNILHTTPKDMFPARYETYGGYELAERQMVAFLPDALYYTLSCEARPLPDGSLYYGMPFGYAWEYPMQVIEIRPENKRFAEELTHRDYLGSLMNLGIERCKLGDIIVNGDTAVVFARNEITDYIVKNLTRIRHTTIQLSVKETTQISYNPKYEELKGTVPSVRLDTVLSVAYPLSRSKLTSYIMNARVFVNGKLITSNGYHLKEKDIISVRGMGRIAYEGVLSETKKGRYMISVRKYI